MDYVKQHNLSQYEERFENIDLKDINRRNDIIEQLKQIGKELNIPVYSEDSKDAVSIAKNGVCYAKENGIIMGPR